jgi:hypothetical protein
MSLKNLLKLTLDNRVNTLAIVGLAKNAGKTVTLNTLIREAAVSNLVLAVSSYGRDGEDTDVITLKKKPRIFIPPETYFITTEKLFEKSNLQASIFMDTGIDTLLGRVKIYKSGSVGDTVELAGVNRCSMMIKIKKLLPDNIGLFLIDGALDRFSSAMPSLVQAMILVTGAVVGNTVEMIVQKTMEKVMLYTLPDCNSYTQNIRVTNILKSGKSSLIRNSTTIGLNFGISGGDSVSASNIVKSGDVLVLNGALTDALVEPFILSNKVSDFTIIVRDNTRIFLNPRNIKILMNKNIVIRVFKSVRLIAITVNPYSPYGFRIDSDYLVQTLKLTLLNAGIDLPVFDVKAKNYS